MVLEDAGSLETVRYIVMKSRIIREDVSRRDEKWISISRQYSQNDAPVRNI